MNVALELINRKEETDKVWQLDKNWHLKFSWKLQKKIDKFFLSFIYTLRVHMQQDMIELNLDHEAEIHLGKTR